jgi:multiple sugar transport system ATP-binding protein
MFVARFIGSPTMNIVKGESAGKRGADTIGIRPEHTDISTTAGEWPGRVRLAEHLGSETFVYVDTDNVGDFTIRADGEAPLHAGDRVFLTPREPRLHKFNAAGQRIAA